MSSEAIGYVFRQSSARGTTRLVHLAIADVANDAHDYRVWVPIRTIADKAGVSPASVKRATQWLVDQGYLERLSPPGNPGDGQAVEYRMNVGGLAQGEPRGSAQDELGLSSGRAGGLAQGEPSREQEPLNSREQLKRTQGVAESFDRFWNTYPRKDDKVKARRAWPGALKIASADDIIAGAARYRDDPSRDPAFTKLPATWLHAGSWGNGPLPARADRNGQVAEPEPAHL